MLVGFVIFFEFPIVDTCDDLELGWPNIVIVTNKNYYFKCCLKNDFFSIY